MKDCLLIADDLTGACDAAAPFAAAGLRTVVALSPGREDAPVLSISTESRDIEPPAAAGRMRQLADRLRGTGTRVLFKKIDSTLRGNSGVEVVAALDAFGCDAAIVNPAFPAMGRVVSAGRLCMQSGAGFQPIELAAWLREHGGEPCRHVRAGGVAAAIEGGTRFVTLDAVSNEDLTAIVGEVLALERRILWAGSAGLSRALAGPIAAGAPTTAGGRGPVLFIIGSEHPLTALQERRLRENRPEAVVMRIERGRAPAIADRPGALFLSGGDTASLVCRALGVEAIELEGEFAPGIPRGILRGGRFDGLPVITKSGGFGGPNTLIRIADFYHD